MPGLSNPDADFAQSCARTEEQALGPDREAAATSQFSFSKAQRVTRKSEYDQIFAQGEKAVGRHFVCYWTRQCGQGCKLGLVVSRKVGKAVVRTRVKRYLREFFRLHRPQMEPDVQLVIIARPSSGTLDFHQCAATLRQLLEQRNLLHG